MFAIQYAIFRTLKGQRFLLHHTPAQGNRMQESSVAYHSVGPSCRASHNLHKPFRRFGLTFAGRLGVEG
jgi:hypothetical protein